MSTKRRDKGEVEEPVKKGPALVISLVFLMVFLVVTGVLLVRWYLENVHEQMEDTSGGRVLVSGIAVLVLLILLVVILINMFRKKQRTSMKRPVQRKKTRKTTYK